MRGIAMTVKESFDVVVVWPRPPQLRIPISQERSASWVGNVVVSLNQAMRGRPADRTDRDA